MTRAPTPGRHFRPGRWSHDQSRAVPLASQCLCQVTEFKCHLGRDCPYGETELANVVPLRRVVPIQPAIVVHRVPLRRRLARSLKALWRFLTQPNFRG